LGCQKVPEETRRSGRHEDKKSSFTTVEFSAYEVGGESEEISRSIIPVSMDLHEVGNDGCLHRNDITTPPSEETSVEPHGHVIRHNREKTLILQDKTEGVQAYPTGFTVRHIIPLDTLRTPTSISPSAKCKISSVSITETRHLTLLSDWANLFEGCESGFTKSGSLFMQKSSSPGSFFKDWPSARESRLAVVITPKKISLPPGKVMAMFHTKTDYLFQILNLDSTFNEVVDLFLFKESGNRLPVSFSKTGVKRPTIMTTTRMRTTLSENLGPQFDAQNQGLIFSTGCINSGACYKMNLVELSTLEQTFSMICPDKLTEN